MTDEQNHDATRPDADATEPTSGSRWEPGQMSGPAAAPLSVNLGGGSPTGPGAPAEPIPYAPIAYQPPPTATDGPRTSRRRFPALGAVAAALAIVVGGTGGYVLAHDAGTSGTSDYAGFSDRSGDGIAPGGDHRPPPPQRDDDGGSSTGEGSGSDT